jgi:hypothetical protein
MVSDLEGERQQNPIDIALAVFRFRARRGIGVYYGLLSTAPILVGVLESLSPPLYIILISVALLVLGILFFARLAGMKRIYQMSLVMDLLGQKQKKERHGHRLNRLLESARIVLVTLLPLVGATIFAITGSAILGSVVLIAFVAYVVAYYFLVFSKKSAESVLPWRIEDWLVALLSPTLLLLSFFQVLKTLNYLVSLLLLFLLSASNRRMKHLRSLCKYLATKAALSENHYLRRENKMTLAFPNLLQEAPYPVLQGLE